MRRARPARPGWRAARWRLRGDRIRANLDVRTDRCDRYGRPRARRRRRRRRRRSRAPPRRPAPRRRRRPSRPPRRWAPRAGSRPAPPARRSSSRETVCCGERSEGGSGGQRRARASVARGRRVDCLSARQNVRADRGFPRAAPGVFEGVRGRGNARLGLDAIDRGRSPRDRATIAPGQPRTRPARGCLRLLLVKSTKNKNSIGREDLRTHRPPSKEPRREPRSVFFRPTVLSAKCARAHDVSRLARLGSAAQRETPEAVLVLVHQSPEPQRRGARSRWSRAVVSRFLANFMTVCM